MVKGHKNKTKWTKLPVKITVATQGSSLNTTTSQEENSSTSRVQGGRRSEGSREYNRNGRSYDPGVGRGSNVSSREMNDNQNWREGKRQSFPSRNIPSRGHIPREEGNAEAEDSKKPQCPKQEENKRQIFDLKTEEDKDEKLATSSKLEENAEKIFQLPGISRNSSSGEEDVRDKIREGLDGLDEDRTNQTPRGFNTSSYFDKAEPYRSPARNRGFPQSGGKNNTHRSFGEHEEFDDYKNKTPAPSSHSSYIRNRNSGSERRHESRQYDDKTPKNASYTNRTEGYGGGSEPPRHSDESERYTTKNSRSSHREEKNNTHRKSVEHEEDEKNKSLTPHSSSFYNKKRNSGNEIYPNGTGGYKGGYGGGKIFYECSNDEQREFLKYVKSEECANYTKVHEVEKNLFDVGEDYALAHCVAEDMNMGSGIAVEFRYRFQRIPELLNQNAKTGGLALLEFEGRFIYYLVTKALSRGKPTYATLWSSLCHLRAHIRDHKVKKLAIPRIACGLDRLEWETVKPMVEFIFRDEDLYILVCNYQMEGTSPAPLKKCKVVLSEKEITDIESETTILYFASKDGVQTQTMKNLDQKFKFFPEFDRAQKELGQIIRTQPMFNKSFIIYGCIVKNKHDDQFDYVAFNDCLRSIRKNSKKDGFYYAAFQIEKDEILNAKILTLMKHTLRDMDIYVCGCTETLSIVEE